MYLALECLAGGLIGLMKYTTQFSIAYHMATGCSNISSLVEGHPVGDWLCAVS